MSAHGFDLALAFDTDDVGFARGVEIGILWATLHGDMDDHEMTMHASSSEMVARIADATGREFRVEYDDEHWMQVWFGRVV